MIRGTNPVLKTALAVLLLTPLGAAANVNINVMNYSFSPNNVTINPGDTVTWNWVGGVHTITSGVASNCTGAGTLFDENSDVSHQMFVFTFTNAGVFDYFCRVHEHMGMKGVVRVKGLTFNGTPSAGNLVNFTVSNLPPTDENLKAIVLLSITGMFPGISFGPCIPVVPVALDQVTLLGLSVSSAFTTGPITSGMASTPSFLFPSAPPGLTVFAAAIVINLSTGGFGSVLPSTQFTTQ